MKKNSKNQTAESYSYLRILLIVVFFFVVYDYFKSNQKEKINKNTIKQSKWGGNRYNPGWWNGEKSANLACEYLVKNEKFSPNAAAAILGNFKYESNLNPYKREGIGKHSEYGNVELAKRLDPDNDEFGPGRGLAQWGDGSGKNGLGGYRWNKLIKYVNKRYNKNYKPNVKSSWNNAKNSNEVLVRKEWPNLFEQLAFIKYEINNGYSSGNGTLRFKEFNKMSLDKATYHFAAIYENPNKVHMKTTLVYRQAEAKKMYEKCKKYK